MKPMSLLFQGSLYLTAVSQLFLFLLWGGEILLKDRQMGFRRVCIQRVPEFESDVNWKLICYYYFILDV